MSFWPLIGLNAVVMMALMAILWKVHFRIHNAGIVDVGWAGGLAFIAALDALLGNGYASRRALIGGMVVLWGMRLALHLWFDRIVGKPEEPRYAALREAWHDVDGKKFFFMFQFQALLDVVLSLPVLVSVINPNPSGSALEISGFVLWACALTGESAADAQLKRFKSDPANKGKTCRAGLWNYSRHPNYFFEWLTWIAYFLFALASPHGWVTGVCPLVMLYFLLKVTGIPATEAQALKSRGDEYREYQRTTSMFVPWFKKEAL
jgi:steroid 5-alpha reductase family enzyme